MAFGTDQKTSLELGQFPPGRLLLPGASRHQKSRSAIAGVAASPISGDGVDDSIRRDSADAVVAGVCNIEVPVGVSRQRQAYPVWGPGDFRAYGGSAVTGVARLLVARNCADDPVR